MLTLRQHPGESELRRCATFFPRDLGDALHEVEISLKVFPLESGCGAPVIIFRQILETLDLSGEETTPERAVWDEADSKLAERRENSSSGSRVQSEYSD